MKPIRIAPDSSVEELAMLALSVHNAACGMPIVVRGRNSSGVLIENGEFIISAMECNSLECLFSGDCTRQIRLGEGRHQGTTMFASAIVNALGQRIAAIGIIDTLGMLSLEQFVADRDAVERQLEGRRPHR